MISTFLAEYPLLVRAVLLAFTVLVLVVAVLLVRAGRWGRRLAWVLAAAAGGAILLLTLSPDGSRGAPVACNFVPYMFYRDEANMALFFVPALFATVASRRPLLVLASAAVLSAGIEGVQRLTATNRRCDIDDWLANSMGGAAGGIAACLVIWAFGARHRPSDGQRAPVK
jgi:glycopeptide antibiotics resistance protein